MMRLSGVGEYCQSNRRALALGGLVSASFVFCYAGVVTSLADQWRSNDMYSYGFLIPVISAYLVWLCREKLAGLQAAPNQLLGWPVLLAGLLMLVAGKAGAVLTLQELSLVVAMAGAALLILGTRLLRVLGFPIAYLLFMIPIWNTITDRLHLPFQIFSANLGVTLLQAVGIPVYREGILIHLPNITLEVARVCSGVNYLIAVIAIGIPMAAIFLSGWRRRVLLIGFGVAVAALSNSLRVALVGALVYHGFDGPLHGPSHVLQGLFVSMIGYGALFMGLWVLSRFPARVALPEPLQLNHSPVNCIAKKSAMAYLGISVSVLLLLAGSYSYFHKPSFIPLKRELNTFPLEIGDWKTIGMATDNLVYHDLGLDHELSRTYRKSTGEAVQLYLGYYGYQEQGREIVGDKTAALHRNASKAKVSLNSHGTIEINRLIQHEDKRNKLVLFWYDLNGRVVADQRMAKAYTAWDALSRGRSNSAIVILTSEFHTEEDVPRNLAASQAFIQEIWPLLPDYLPAD